MRLREFPDGIREVGKILHQLIEVHRTRYVLRLRLAVSEPRGATLYERLSGFSAAFVSAGSRPA